VSNSDAHSPAKLGREANLLSCEMSYPALKRALETGIGFDGTIEFYPEEGKYHLDGHRNCHLCLEPAQTIEYGGRCPVCGRKLTVGVSHRVEALADRAEPAALPKPFENLIPLPEVLADCMGVSPASKKVDAAYMALLKQLGPEFTILRTLPPEIIEQSAGPVAAEAIRRLRKGRVIRHAGYDGEYGVIKLFEPGEVERLTGQTSLFGLAGLSQKAAFRTQGVAKKKSQPAPEAPAASTAPLLNPQQLAAVESTAAQIAVVAGPGTGKTKTLVARIAHLIENQGVSPSEITAVTFTRQAAKEMLERLTAQLGTKAVRGLNVGTFHAICLNLLDKRGILSRQQAQEIIATLLAEHEESLSPAECLRLISIYKNNLCMRSQETSSMPAWRPGAYEQRLEMLGLRDLDDVLLHALRQPVSARKSFRHMLVDEFQDINAVQHELIRLWSRESASLFVIGDPDQAIYGFRGAQADCFDTFLTQNPDAQLIRLSSNYRSTPQIIETALSAIRANPGMKRELISRLPSGLPVRIVEAPDTFSESVWIAKEIGHMVGGVDMLDAQHEHGERSVLRSFSDIAILCRTHRQLEQIEDALNHDSIPCIISGHDEYLSDKNVQGMIGFFASLLDPRDSTSLQAALDGLWRIPAALIQPAAVALSSMERADFGLLNEALCDFPLLKPWLNAVEILLPRLKLDKPRKLIEKLAGLCQLDSDAVTKLLNTAVFYDDLVSLLSSLRMNDSADIHRASGAGYASGAVRLMTLHASKGLEFPVVFLAGVTAGMLPIERAQQPTDEAEERRLFFVGITRAKEELILTCGGKPSRFADELPSTITRRPVRARVKAPKTEQLSLFDL
ncbi:MAG: UvrD-helicase domain-containing protein, partial [Clostridia bacterium]|nr:UvrD-helicase domain-containing protein [Clostridia bacterium]